MDFFFIDIKEGRQILSFTRILLCFMALFYQLGYCLFFDKNILNFMEETFCFNMNVFCIYIKIYRTGYKIQLYSSLYNPLDSKGFLFINCIFSDLTKSVGPLMKLY